jgi:hypothetical protein
LAELQKLGNLQVRQEAEHARRAEG